MLQVDAHEASHRGTARFAALGDGELLELMRAGEPRAWTAFDGRFRPFLQAFARRQSLAPDVQHVCVDDVLAEEGLRLTLPDAVLPRNLPAYLLRAARHRFYNYRRQLARRYARYLQMAEDDPSEGVVVDLCSEYTRRSGARAGSADDPFAEPHDDPLDGTAGDVTGACASGQLAIAHLMTVLAAEMTPEEHLVLDWVAGRVPHSVMASWLGRSPAATSKRVSRLLRRLRLAALDEVAGLPPEEYRQLARVLRRADVAAPPHEPPLEGEGRGGPSRDAPRHSHRPPR